MCGYADEETGEKSKVNSTLCPVTALKTRKKESVGLNRNTLYAELSRNLLDGAGLAGSDPAPEDAAYG